MPKSPVLKGALYIFISALLYATLPILCKFAYQTGLSPVQALLLRYLLALIILSSYLLWRRQHQVFSLTPLVILQGLVMAVSGLCYFFALQYLSAGLTTVILFSHPVMVAILAALLYRERIGWRVATGILLAIGGVILVSGVSTGSMLVSPLGLAWITVASILYAFYNIMGQRNVAQVNPLTIANTIALMSVLVVGIAFRDGAYLLRLSSTQIFIGLGLGLVNTVLAISFFLKGMGYIGATRASLIATLEPVLTLILAFFLLGETLQPLQLLGVALVLASMLLAVRPATPQQEEIGYERSTSPLV